MSDLEYIKKFSKIKIKDICKRLHINSANLWSGRTSKENIKKVREEIEKELSEIGDKNVEDNTL